MLLLLSFAGVAALLFIKYKKHGTLDPLSVKAQRLLFENFGDPSGPVRPESFLEFFGKLDNHLRFPVLQISGLRRIVSPGTAIMAAKRHSMSVSIKIKRNELVVSRSYLKNSLPEEKDFGTHSKKNTKGSKDPSSYKVTPKKIK